ncbi:MAG: hypothetical protein U0T75_11290 [Chitinophagales bacterium]
MELQEFTTKFAACFNQTDASLILPATEFRALEEWGSMLALIVIAMIDSDYGKTITAEDLRSVQTVEQLFNLVKAK